MRNGFALAFTIFCMVFTISPSLFADECRMEKGKMSMHGDMDNKLDFEDMFFHKIYFILSNKDALGLNDAQMEKILSIKYTAKKNLIQKESEIDLLALDIMEEMRKDEINMTKVNGLVDSKYEAKKQKAKQLIESYVAVKTVLTKEQHKKLKDLWHDMMGKTMRRHCPMMETEEKSEMSKADKE